MDRLPWRAEPEEEILDHLLLEGTSGRTGKEERQLIYLRYFADRTQAQAGKRTWHISGTGLKIGKKDFKSMRTNLAGISGYIF